MTTKTHSLRGIRQGLALTGMLAGMLLGAGSILAQTPDGDMPRKTITPEMRQHMEERCKADPVKCEEMKKRIEEKRAACKADPEACKKEREAHKAKMEERRKAMQAQCEKDPVACEKKREEFRQKMEERCKADPVKCEEWKKKHPELPDGQRPPPPPPTAAN